jgi:hypothetical protein
VARMEECCVVFGGPEKKRPLVELDVDGSILLSGF